MCFGYSHYSPFSVWDVNTCRGTNELASPSPLPAARRSVDARFKPISVPQLGRAWKWGWGALESGLGSRASKVKEPRRLWLRPKQQARPGPQGCGRPASGGLGGRDTFPLRWPGALKNRNSIRSHGGVVVEVCLNFILGQMKN